jgi:hypothetical protein
MNTIKHKLFLNHFWFFMAFYFLNISIDYQDIKANYDLKETSFNEQESIIELVVEKALGFGNVISEDEADDSDKNNTLKNNFILNTKKVINYHKCNSYKTSLAINSPPPENSFL